MLIEAVAAHLPADLLTGCAHAPPPPGVPPARARGSGKARLRGRPLPARPGTPDGRGRIDLIATLRRAAPWQPLRRRRRPDAPGLIIHAADIHLKRFEDRADRLVIFAVDASGSSALARWPRPRARWNCCWHRPMPGATGSR